MGKASQLPLSVFCGLLLTVSAFSCNITLPAFARCSRSSARRSNACRRWCRCFCWRQRSARSPSLPFPTASGANPSLSRRLPLACRHRGRHVARCRRAAGADVRQSDVHFHTSILVVIANAASLVTDPHRGDRWLCVLGLWRLYADHRLAVGGAEHSAVGWIPVVVGGDDARRYRAGPARQHALSACSDRLVVAGHLAAAKRRGSTPARESVRFRDQRIDCLQRAKRQTGPWHEGRPCK